MGIPKEYLVGDIRCEQDEEDESKINVEVDLQPVAEHIEVEFEMPEIEEDANENGNVYDVRRLNDMKEFGTFNESEAISKHFNNWCHEANSQERDDNMLNTKNVYDVYVYDKKGNILNKEDDIVAGDKDEARFNAKVDIVIRDENLTPSEVSVRIIRKFSIPVKEEEE